MWKVFFSTVGEKLAQKNDVTSRHKIFKNSFIQNFWYSFCLVRSSLYQI